ncbi:D-alanyl-lipoteichoic acid biosynthesis protein DltD [Olsenella sp. HMSC062G07]|uniref:D-alanyl-lipoteichoic acid biosynthesis protein DltD n=1 Tax=Olsenella sp. HMSC062G07 TaxID=1739330 RepID=UPI0008A21A97|nr:D-alanyl-lipoteichoic acid biosynthesis protein DltD [Olsenella sp. HMSC062G07]OFK23266.1 D-alanyl-lipoteichoic acid biosynthesis protein DltD [Olsenella sp. HMSC062G07]
MGRSPDAPAAARAKAAAGTELSRRAFLGATLGGLATLGLGLAAAGHVINPDRQGWAADDSLVYDYVVDTLKFGAIDWVVSTMSPYARLALGSSEFYVSSQLVPQVPPNVFGLSNCGVDLTYVGEAYDQCLWHAIAAGAYGNRVRNREALLFLSPQWFFKNPDANNKFSQRFSYELYRAFARNASVSRDSKRYVRRRAESFGIASTLLSAAADDGVLGMLDDLTYHQAEQLKIERGLPLFASRAFAKSDARLAGVDTGEPDWAALLAQGDLDGAAACTNNPLGVNDDFWTRNGWQMFELNQRFNDADSEYGDFSCALDVMLECGLKPLVVLQPMHGAWFDHQKVPADARRVWYDRIIHICDDHGIAYADFSPCEYERYFWSDTVHPGWRGWVRIESAIFHFLNGRDDDFVGGAGFGGVTGTGLQTLRGVTLP